MMGDRRFGAAGATLVIEEALVGEELSCFALTDGVTVLPFGSAQDHKALGDGDTGPNTGGMGAYAPAPCATRVIEGQIMARIVEPALAGLRAAGRGFKGVLFAGVMLTEAGPKLIEFNARFGDPECEVLIRRLRSDLLPVLFAAATGGLDRVSLDWDPRTALGVVLAARGYPERPVAGTIIRGLDRAAASAPEVEIFHAGTALRQGEIVAAGGRVLVVTALGRTVAEAQASAYRAAGLIDWPDGFYRRDIGWRATSSSVKR
jgi:phosphoribosylamine--glycine ligase